MKATLTLIFLTFCALLTQAQERIINGNTTIKQELRQSNLDTNEVVYDESGKALRYYQYQKLLNSGDYTFNIIRTPIDNNPKKVLKKLTTEDKDRVYSLIKNLMVIKSPNLQENKVLNLKPLSKYLNQDQLNNKVILLVFWNVDCPPCTESFSDLDNFVKEIGSPKDLLIFTITSNSKSIATAKLKEKPFANAQLISSAKDTLGDYMINDFPSYVVADKNHIIKFAITGMSQITIPAIKKSIMESLAQ